MLQARVCFLLVYGVCARSFLLAFFNGRGQEKVLAMDAAHANVLGEQGRHDAMRALGGVVHVAVGKGGGCGQTILSDVIHKFDGVFYQEKDSA